MKTKTFTVTKIDKCEGEVQCHMLSDVGDTLRFYPSQKEWMFKSFRTGKITMKQMEKIIDVWYMFENKCDVSIGDSVTV